MKKVYLKWRLKRLYLKLTYGFDNYTCGHKMLISVSSDYYETCKRFNQIADKLSNIDDDCPKFRYELNP